MIRVPPLRTAREPTPDEERRRAAELAATQELARRYAAQAEHPFERRELDAVLRACDVVIAGGLLVLTGPILAAAAVAVALTSGRPVLYRGPRVGRGGRVFEMYKLRTLRPGAEARLRSFQGDELDAHTVAEITWVGHVLRRLHVDELPQLYNVLRGDMSLVGPRPIRPVFFEELCLEIPQYWQRLVVRPGLTGLAQLRIERGMTWAEKLAHDLEWLADRSVGLYLRLLAATAVRVLRRTLSPEAL